MASARGPIGAILENNKIIAITGEWSCELNSVRYSAVTELVEGKLEPEHYYTIALYLDKTESRKRYEAIGLIHSIEPAIKIEGFTGLEYKEE